MEATGQAAPGARVVHGQRAWKPAPREARDARSEKLRVESKGAAAAPLAERVHQAKQRGEGDAVDQVPYTCQARCRTER